MTARPEILALLTTGRDFTHYDGRPFSDAERHLASQAGSEELAEAARRLRVVADGNIRLAELMQKYAPGDDEMTLAEVFSLLSDVDLAEATEIVNLHRILTCQA
jgi:hypothetical protein